MFGYPQQRYVQTVLPPGITQAAIIDFSNLVEVPHQTWMQATSELATDREIASRLAELTLGNQTETLVEEIANAPSGDSAQLQQMINNAVAKAIKSERKNLPRGATIKNGASSTK